MKIPMFGSINVNGILRYGLLWSFEHGRLIHVNPQVGGQKLISQQMTPPIARIG